MTLWGRINKISVELLTFGTFDVSLSNILKGADPFLKNQDCCTPLMQAATNAHISDIEALIKRQRV